MQTMYVKTSHYYTDHSNAIIEAILSQLKDAQCTLIANADSESTGGSFKLYEVKYDKELIAEILQHLENCDMLYLSTEDEVADIFNACERLNIPLS